MPLSDTTNSPKTINTGSKSKSFIGKMFSRKSSKSDVAITKDADVTAKEAITAAEVTVTPAPAAPTFFAVVHTFLEGKAEGFFAQMGALTEKDFAAMAEKHHGLGFHNHSFMPTGMDSNVLCVWECKENTTTEDFQSFIDGPDGPAEGVFSNKCYKVMPGAIAPTSFFHAAPAASAPVASTGSFFWVHHSFKEGAAPAFWEMMGSMTPEGMEAMTSNNNKLGFHNHAFLPCAQDGPHAAICIWESKAPMSVEAFQTFIDGPDGPGAGNIFNNEVNLVMPGAALPSAHFTSPPVVHVCSPCDGAEPDKTFGPVGGAQAKLWLNKLPDGRQTMRIKIQKGFDWRSSISPILPGCPMWCPATHFGYLESGTMGIKMSDGSERTVKAGETYLVLPGHLPVLSEDAVMVEFSQDTTYTKDIKK